MSHHAPNTTLKPSPGTYVMETLYLAGPGDLTPRDRLSHHTVSPSTPPGHLNFLPCDPEAAALAGRCLLLQNAISSIHLPHVPGEHHGVHVYITVLAVSCMWKHFSGSRGRGRRGVGQGQAHGRQLLGCCHSRLVGQTWGFRQHQHLSPVTGSHQDSLETAQAHSSQQSLWWRPCGALGLRAQPLPMGGHQLLPGELLAQGWPHRSLHLPVGPEHPGRVEAAELGQPGLRALHPVPTAGASLRDLWCQGGTSQV